MTSVASEIRREHEAATMSAKNALEHARRAGELLAQVKAKIPHGYWLLWLKENCPEIAERTAQAYMRLAQRWPELEGKTQRVAGLPVRQALVLLSEPRERSEELSVLPADLPEDFDWEARGLEIDEAWERLDIDMDVFRHSERPDTPEGWRDHLNAADEFVRRAIKIKLMAQCDMVRLVDQHPWVLDYFEHPEEFAKWMSSP